MSKLTVEKSTWCGGREFWNICSKKLTLTLERVVQDAVLTVDTAKEFDWKSVTGQPRIQWAENVR